MKNVIRVGQILVGLIVLAGIVLLMARPSPQTGDETPTSDFAASIPSTDGEDDTMDLASAESASGDADAPIGPEIGALESNRAARNVTPEGVLPAPDVAWPIERAEPRAVPEPRKPPPEPARFFRAGVPDAGRITTRHGYDVVLSGIDAPAVDETCIDGTGTRWPCGRAAQASLSRLIRGRAVDCDIEPERLAALVEANLVVRAVCHVAGREINWWLVEQGWARPGGDDRFGEIFETAKSEGRGMWIGDWSAR